MKNIFNNAQRQAQKREALKIAVMRSLRWNEFTYNKFLFDQGIEYLYTHMGVPLESRTVKVKEASDWVLLIAKSSIFWSWWKNHWMQRDAYFLDRIQIMNCKSIETFYCKVQNGVALSETIHPHRIVLEEAYAPMMDELIAVEKNK